MSGEKRICLAITEPWAGSDVAGLRTTAKRTEDGKHYMVSGTKKWITNGTWCDYFVTAVKTPKGLSVLLIERGPGVETKPIKTSYSSHAPGTSLVTFTDVKVPVENRLGEEGNGLRIVLSNFNHERWTMAASIIRTSRLITEECIKWSNQRVIFGKPLIEQPVIRQKYVSEVHRYPNDGIRIDIPRSPRLAKMIAHCEANQAWLENVTYQMTTMTYEQWNKQLAGPISLLKMFATRSAHEIADESVQIFGGRGITATGMGRLVENFHRTYKVDAVPGGSEEVLADLGVRQAMKSMPKAML